MLRINPTQESRPLYSIQSKSSLKRSLNPIKLNPLLAIKPGRTLMKTNLSEHPKHTQVLQRSPKKTWAMSTEERKPSQVKTYLREIPLIQNVYNCLKETFLRQIAYFFHRASS